MCKSTNCINYDKCTQKNIGCIDDYKCKGYNPISRKDDRCINIINYEIYLCRNNCKLNLI